MREKKAKFLKDRRNKVAGTGAAIAIEIEVVAKGRLHMFATKRRKSFESCPN